MGVERLSRIDLLTHSGDMRIAIIGAGPAGLAAAERLTDRGYADVSIFEGDSQVGGKVLTRQVDGRPYDLGAAIVLTRFNAVRARADRYGVDLKLAKAPAVVDMSSGKWLSPPARAARFLNPAGIRTNLKLSSALQGFAHYTTKPGYRNMPAELQQTFSQWSESRGLGSLQSLYEFFTVDMGYGPYNEIPAGYLIKGFCADPALTRTEALRRQWNDVFGTRVFANGFQDLLRTMASHYNVHLNHRVQRVRRNDQGVWLTFASDPSHEQRFDKLIVAAPLGTSTQFMDHSKHELEMCNREEYTPYYVTIADSRGLPDASGHFTLGSQKIGRAGGHISNRPWPDSTLRAFYHYGDPADQNDPDLAIQRLKDDLNFVGAELTDVEITQAWPTYFPRVSTAALADGHYAEVDRLQGARDTYYVGSSHTFETVDAVFKYSEYLIDREFPSPNDRQAR